MEEENGTEMRGWKIKKNVGPCTDWQCQDAMYRAVFSTQFHVQKTAKTIS